MSSGHGDRPERSSLQGNTVATPGSAPGGGLGGTTWAPGGGRGVARPTRAGDWELEAALGAGGMGTVYRARHTLDPQLRAAVKLVPVGGEGEGARFLREVQAISRLHHPALARLLSFGVEGAFGYVAMGLVEGETLEASLRGGAIFA